VDELRDVGDEERDRVTEPAVDNESDDGNDRIGEDVRGGGSLENDIKKASSDVPGGLTDERNRDGGCWHKGQT